MIDLFQRLSTHSRQALKTAFNLAVSCGQPQVTPLHLLFGLANESGSLASQILVKAKISGEKIEATIKKDATAQTTITQTQFSLPTKKILEKAFWLAGANQNQYIGTEHLLLAALKINDQQISEFLSEKKVDVSEIKEQLTMIFNSTAKFPDLTENFNQFNQHPTHQNSTANFALESFATELTDPRLQQKIDPVIGRGAEIDRLIQILCRRHKNNPLLLGEAGVGKTAIVEGLAKKIISKEAPAILADKKIFNLDLSSLVAGTSFRGEFENRLKQVISEASQRPEVILFIDEIHNLTGAGAATGSMDAANILKPALARGEIHCIGATTPEAFKKQIESDPAMERRFQTIQINQATVSDTIKILQGLRKNYELYHDVEISDEALAAAAQLAERYIFDRCLPDKAIDLIDEAAAAARITKQSQKILSEAEKLQAKLNQITEEKINFAKNEDFESALTCHNQEQKLIEQIEAINSQKKTKIKDQKKSSQVTAADIAKMVAKITGIPQTELLTEEKSKLLNLEKKLSKKIVGQLEAINSIAEAIRRARIGLSDTKRPLGSFIFLGPSGVGKTELAKVLAETIFGSPQALIKIDMSEFSEAFNISKLIGAPAGYVGYKEGAKLTDAVKRRPYSVVLFDEIEKAHPQVFYLLLQVLEDGYLTDASGKTIDFRHTIIILTSNLGSENFNQQAAIGFNLKEKKAESEILNNLLTIENSVLKKLKEKFPPEFLSRIDKTLVFKPLNSKELAQIAKRQLLELQKKLANLGVKINIPAAVVNHLAQKSQDATLGGRAVRKNIQALIENPISIYLLSGKNKTKKIINLKVKNNKIIIN
ncbi:MAG: ATP-dependent Clp protease ATP-binding subunit [Candidatus Buchananbacteria bacterium]